MPVLQANQVLAPFLSRPMTFVRGLDPLGLQNTTEATFTVLLPGLNNVSRKIRYYPFYCWLLDCYGKEDSSLDPKRQRSFIRRAELIVALVNQCLPKPSGDIPGTEYAATYNALKDAVEEIIWKYKIYNPSYLKSLNESFNKKFDTSGFKRFIIGNYDRPADIHKRPLAKITQDIAKQIGLLK